MTVIDPGVGEPASLLADTLAVIKPPDEAAMDVATFDSAGVSGAKD